jgi:hypothetical protein
MKIEDIIQKARAGNETSFGKVSDKRAAKILRAAFRQVNSQLELTKSGTLRINGLGQFTIRKIERETNGVKATKRRVIFSAGAKPPDKQA